ncbi:MAG: phosphoribosylformylglycinamidine synthase [Acidobacteriota bacterium]
MQVIHYFRSPGFSPEHIRALLDRVRREISPEIEAIETEYCFNVEIDSALEEAEDRLLRWLLAETFEPERFGPHSYLNSELPVIEVGPRLSFNTAWCTNAVSIFHNCGLRKVRRIERSRRYALVGPAAGDPAIRESFTALIYDRMTECPYPRPLESFESGTSPEPTVEIPVLEDGRAALERLNREAGLAFDDWDLDYYTQLFRDVIKRNPTNVECFDIAQSNSEHSRHWFFKGRLIIDGQERPGHLIALVREPLEVHPNNSTIAFCDNSSAIRGYPVRTLLPERPGSSSPYVEAERDHDIIFTAETHNFPSGVAPFPGAETGTGGRIRDGHATGRGSLVVAGTAAYCVGNLRIPGYPLPWEDETFRYPESLASPLQIEIEASNGASDYGNKFGEPVILGYTRALGLRLPDGQRREWIKPIMFSGGIGQIDAQHLRKWLPEKGMWVVKIGGPAYRIGLGGGAASSMVQGENVAELDFNAVQRGDAEMEQKVNRVIRACVELGERNPIISIHDQGAGGNCNVLKEIVSPAGARIEVRKIPIGDETLSVLEIWVAEYQEQDALLLRDEHTALFEALCKREKVPVALVGRITGDGRIVLHDDWDGSTPVDLDLDHVLGAMPQKVFTDEHRAVSTRPLELPENLGVRDAVERVLRLLSVGSKRFLTNKVDRSVTGLVARQQCAGPLQLTVSDVAVIAQNHLGVTGAATSIGEQPVMGLLNPAAMARMTVGEALTNLIWARVSALEDVKCSANWMWAAKLPGEAAALTDAAQALRDVLVTLGIAIDGGKDSLSMAALAPKPDGGEETVKAPGSLVISTYVTCPDIRMVVTPDLKRPGGSELLYINLGKGLGRLGGSSLAQVFRQLGETPPDLDDPVLLKRTFTAIQSLIEDGKILAGHDRSDGGLITALLEMAFAGNCGLEVDVEAVNGDPIPTLFSEELGLLLEIAPSSFDEVATSLRDASVPFSRIGKTRKDARILVKVDGRPVLDDSMPVLRDIWEETSYRLELLQANPESVEQERNSLKTRTGPAFRLTFQPEPTSSARSAERDRFKVAVLREEGSNGDREMGAAFHLAGFETWDVTMTDLAAGRVALEEFRGLVFPGGFSYADVLDSAKGWAGVIRFNPRIWEQVQTFYSRPDTFSLGVCNGCQLMALIGWIPWPEIPDVRRPRFIQNRSGRFESRFTTVTIEPSPAIMLKGMTGSVLGVWVAHGEGQAYFPDTSILEQIEKEHLVPLRFVNDAGRATEEYPFNPNGSPLGIAGLCSRDGRHLVMMPHPERAFLKWQWGWMPEDWKENLESSPWLRMFQNARVWCEQDET